MLGIIPVTASIVNSIGKVIYGIFKGRRKKKKIKRAYRRELAQLQQYKKELTEYILSQQERTEIQMYRYRIEKSSEPQEYRKRLERKFSSGG